MGGAASHVTKHKIRVDPTIQGVPGCTEAYARLAAPFPRCPRLHTLGFMNTLAAIVSVIDLALNLVIYVLIAQAILSWLIAFNVVSLRSNGVRQVAYTLDRVTAPILRPIRRILPDMGGIDLSPMAAWLIIILVQRLLHGLIADAMLAH